MFVHSIAIAWELCQFPCGVGLTPSNDRYAEHFIKRYDRNLPVRAFDKDQRYGGQLVGWLRLTQKPYRERLGDMPSSDVAAEGFLELLKPRNRNPSWWKWWRSNLRSPATS